MGKAKKDEVSFRGRVLKVRMHRKPEGFCVFDVEPQETVPSFDGSLFSPEKICVVCSADAPPAEGLVYRLAGSWHTHPSYGLQFRASAVFPETAGHPAGSISLKAAIEFLAHTFDRIGEARASAFVAKNGPESVKCIINGTYAGLEDAKGALEIMKSQPVADKARALLELAFFNAGLRPRWVNRVIPVLGPEALSLIRTNPYLLAKVPGIGFRKADLVAEALGYEKDSVVRRFGALCLSLSEKSQMGHSCCRWEELKAAAAGKTGLPPEAFEGVLKEVVGGSELIICETVEEKGVSEKYAYEASLYENEQRAAAVLGRMLPQPAPWGLGPKTVLGFLERERLSFPLTDLQKKAACMPFIHRVSVLTGLPGTGKTTAAKAVLLLSRKFGIPLFVAAPTGRAAMRISEVMGCKASTIHRLLLSCRGPEPGKAPQILSRGVYIIDETSMLDLLLFRRFLESLPEDSSVLFIGDANQLPSVSPGNVLADLTLCCPNHVHLTEVFRQSMESGIIRAAHALYRGQAPRPSESSVVKDGFSDCHFFVAKKVPGANGKPTADPESVKSLLKDFLIRQVKGVWQMDPADTVQVLTPQKKGPLGTDALNGYLQGLMNPKRHGPKLELSNGCAWRGDKVMVTSNSYRHGVFNGEIASLEFIDTETKRAHLRFVDRNVEMDLEEAETMLQLAYASTIHKSQGCEYPVVVVIAHKSHAMMLSRNLMYTAVTRAQQRLVFIGDPVALWIASRENRDISRTSLLAWRVKKRAAVAA